MTEYTGELRLTVKKRAEKTVPDRTFFKGALKVMRPQYFDTSGQLTYFILNPGGGYLDGDRYGIQIELAENTNLFLTTQSATKIYQTPTDEVRQISEYFLAANSELVNIPDPIIPYENSTYYQEQILYLANSAQCFLSEIVTPGWDSLARGFTYRELNLLTKIYVDNELVIMDRLYFTPEKSNLAGIGMLEHHSKVASVMAIHPDITQDFVSTMHQILTADFPELTFGISLLPIAGFSIRFLGESTQQLEAAIKAVYEGYSQKFSQREKSLLRKY